MACFPRLDAPRRGGARGEAVNRDHGAVLAGYGGAFNLGYYRRPPLPEVLRVHSGGRGVMLLTMVHDQGTNRRPQGPRLG